MWSANEMGQQMCTGVLWCLLSSFLGCPEACRAEGKGTPFHSVAVVTRQHLKTLDGSGPLLALSLGFLGPLLLWQTMPAPQSTSSGYLRERHTHHCQDSTWDRLAQGIGILSWVRAGGQSHGYVTCAITQGPGFRKAPCLV